MKIPSIGNYLTQDNQTAIVEELGDLVCSGRIAHRPGSVTWSRLSGTCLPFLSGDESLSIVSSAPIPWRERILQLIETAHRDTDRINYPDTLVSGGLRIAIGGGGGCVVLTRDDVAEPVFLHSPEFVGVVDARLKELEAAALRYRDDANVLLIEALLQ
jgi:hypothetical protein